MSDEAKAEKMDKTGGIIVQKASALIDTISAFEGLMSLFSPELKEDMQKAQAMIAMGAQKLKEVSTKIEETEERLEQKGLLSRPASPLLSAFGRPTGEIEAEGEEK